MPELNETKQRLDNINALDEQKHHETHDCCVSISDHGDRFNIKSAPSNFYLFRAMTEHVSMFWKSSSAVQLPSDTFDARCEDQRHDVAKHTKDWWGISDQYQSSVLSEEPTKNTVESPHIARNKQISGFLRSSLNVGNVCESSLSDLHWMLDRPTVFLELYRGKTYL